MTEDELADALLGLYAYDTGSVDAGIHDNVLKRRIFDHLNALTETDVRLTLSRIAREAFMTEERLAQGYGIEDVASFYRWIEDVTSFEIR